VPALLLASNLPDIDAGVLFAPTPLAVTWRRTFGHSVFLIPLLSLALAWLLRRKYRSSSLIALWGLCLLGAYTHVFFDLINSFGVVVLWPFSAWRPELALVFIIDVCLLALLAFPHALRFGEAGRARLARVCRWSSGLVAGYLVFCAANRAYAKWNLDHLFGASGAAFTYVFPEPLGPHRWRCVARRHQAESYDEFLFHSLTGRAEPPLVVPTFSNDPAVLQARASPAGRRLEWFFKAPVWRPEPDGVHVYDLRFRPLVLNRGASFEYVLTPDGTVRR
jgi:inner membrane protein